MTDYEQVLKQIKIEPITEFVDLKKKKIIDKALSCEGIYALWFNNNNFKATNLKYNIVYSGKTIAGKPLKQEISWDWNVNEQNICLYVGKSTNIKKRLSIHLRLKTTNFYTENSNTFVNRKKSPFRCGFDYLFQNQKSVDIIQTMEEVLMFSFIEEKDFKERFYLENYLIGKLLPWFNLDSER